MTAAAGTYRIGAHNASLTLHTGREGRAARVGHDLTITFGTWSGEVVLDGSGPAGAGVEATVEIDSMEIVTGTGGLLPLTDVDRREIRSTALRLLDADHHPQARFTSTAVRPDGESAALAGTLTIRGKAVPASFAVSGAGGTWRASTTVRQSAFGIAPYRAFFGALRLADEVRIDVEAQLPAQWSAGPGPG